MTDEESRRAGLTILPGNLVPYFVNYGHYRSNYSDKTNSLIPASYPPVPPSFNASGIYNEFGVDVPHGGWDPNI